MWHGEAIGRVLAAHGEAAGAPRIAALRRGLGLRDRVAPTLHALGAAMAGTGLRRAAHDLGRRERVDHPGRLRPADRRARHPVLTDLLNRIMRQEGNHVAFYAARPATGSPTTRGPGGWSGPRCAGCGALWARGSCPPEVAFMVGTLFGDPDGPRHGGPHRPAHRPAARPGRPRPW